MNIAAIIDMILALINSCKKKEGRDRVKQRIKNFGIGDGEFAVRLQLRRMGMNRAEINEAVGQLKLAAATASDSDIDELLSLSDDD